MTEKREQVSQPGAERTEAARQARLAEQIRQLETVRTRVAQELAAAHDRAKLEGRPPRDTDRLATRLDEINNGLAILREGQERKP